MDTDETPKVIDDSLFHRCESCGCFTGPNQSRLCIDGKFWFHTECYNRERGW